LAITASDGVDSLPLGSAVVESTTLTLYSIAEIATGFQGGELPSSIDLFIEQATMGLATTGFDE